MMTMRFPPPPFKQEGKYNNILGSNCELFHLFDYQQIKINLDMYSEQIDSTL